MCSGSRHLKPAPKSDPKKHCCKSRGAGQALALPPLDTGRDRNRSKTLEPDLKNPKHPEHPNIGKSLQEPLQQALQGSRPFPTGSGVG